MSGITETVPTVWTAADEIFFRMTSDAFPPAFLAGASVLLASYDDDDEFSTTFAEPATRACATDDSVQQAIDISLTPWHSTER